jgi:hypothetical protein
MIIFWFQIGFGLFMILILITLGIKFSKGKNITNDEKVIKIIKDELGRDGFDHYELKSIISISKPNVTSVIVDVGYQEIALEIDNNSYRIISKERIARQ